jgi:hypothetical protein
MRIFNIDLHISVIADIKNILEDLGHTVTTWSISDSSAIMGQQKAHVDCVCNELGRPDDWRNIGPEMADRFYERYRTELTGFDAFLVTYAPSLSLLFERFGKPIIIVAPIRYEVPFSNDAAKWVSFNEFLRRGHDSGRIILAANNKFDQKYGEICTGRPWSYIPSYCGYTNTTYHRTRRTFLYSSRLSDYSIYLESSWPAWWTKLFGPAALPHVRPKHKALRGRYAWHDMTAYAGIIQIPYNASTMSIFENYAQNIPMFFPTQEFMCRLRVENLEQVMCETTWMQTLHIGDRTPPEIGVPYANDPNRYRDADIFRRWLSYADFYDGDWMPELIYFESFSQLQMQLVQTNLDQVSAAMQRANAGRLARIRRLWQETLQLIAD